MSLAPGEKWSMTVASFLCLSGPDHLQEACIPHKVSFLSHLPILFPFLLSQEEESTNSSSTGMCSLMLKLGPRFPWLSMQTFFMVSKADSLFWSQLDPSDKLDETNLCISFSGHLYLDYYSKHNELHHQYRRWHHQSREEKLELQRLCCENTRLILSPNTGKDCVFCHFPKYTVTSHQRTPAQDRTLRCLARLSVWCMGTLCKHHQ